MFDTRRWRAAFWAVGLLVLLVAVALAHPGGLDSKGGHHNRKTGEYHYHRKTETAPQSAVAPATKQAPTGSQLDAVVTGKQLDTLMTLLIAKGVITQEERNQVLLSGSSR